MATSRIIQAYSKRSSTDALGSFKVSMPALYACNVCLAAAVV